MFDNLKFNLLTINFRSSTLPLAPLDIFLYVIAIAR